MNTDAAALFVRPLTGAALLGLLGGALFPLAVNSLWQAAGLALVFNLVVTMLSLAALVISLVVCWRTLSDETERERFQTLLEQAGLDTE
jgi:uncharacterized membrane protein YcjF (UPF0283 family)